MRYRSLQKVQLVSLCDCEPSRMRTLGSAYARRAPKALEALPSPRLCAVLTDPPACAPPQPRPAAAHRPHTHGWERTAAMSYAHLLLSSALPTRRRRTVVVHLSRIAYGYAAATGSAPAMGSALDPGWARFGTVSVRMPWVSATAAPIASASRGRPNRRLTPYTLPFDSVRPSTSMSLPLQVTFRSLGATPGAATEWR